MKECQPEEEGLVLMKSPRTRQNWMFPQFTVVDHERIIVLSRIGSVFMCSVRTGYRLRTYRRFRIASQNTHDVEIVEDGIFVEAGASLITRRVSNGTELDRFEYNKIHLTSSASLGDGRFLVGTGNGKLLEMRCTKTGKLIHISTVATPLPLVRSISVCKDRFAILCMEKKLVVLFESTRLERVAAVATDSCSKSLHLTEHFLVIGGEDGRIFVHNPITLELVREINKHSSMVLSVHVMGDGRHLVSAGWDGLICIHDLETGALVWQKLFNTGVHMTTLLSDGRLVASFSMGPIILLDIPRDFETKELTVPAPTPLRDAFENCISGAEIPSEQCKELITYDRCRESFDEWCSAHQILMMAVEDGDIPRSRNYNGEVSWWFENLYLAGKDVQLGSDDDVRAMKRFLVEAEKMGVVDGIEPVLAAMKVTKDLKAEVRALQRADILLLERMMSIEARLQMLKDSFERYRKYTRNSQLIGVALQIIPIAGGSVAGIVSAGAEIFEGLSAKDLTDYFLGLGSSLLQDEGSSMSDRVFRSAAGALSQDQMEEMNMEHRRKLEEVVESWGFSVSSLRELFLDQARHGREMECDESGGGLDAVEIVIEEAEDELWLAEAKMLENEIVEDIVGISHETEIEGESRTKLEADGASCTTEGLRLEQPSSWKDFDFDKDIVRGLCQEELASLWAAYIVWNRDERQKEYEVLQECLDCVLKEERLVGELIIDSSALSSDEIVRAVTTGMEKYGVEVKAGDLGRVRQFVSAIRRNE